MNDFKKALSDYHATVRKAKIGEGQRAILAGIPILSASGDYSELVEEALAAQGTLAPTEENAKKLTATLSKMDRAVKQIVRNK